MAGADRSLAFPDRNLENIATWLGTVEAKFCDAQDRRRKDELPEDNLAANRKWTRRVETNISLHCFPNQSTRALAFSRYTATEDLPAVEANQYNHNSAFEAMQKARCK